MGVIFIAGIYLFIGLIFWVGNNVISKRKFLDSLHPDDTKGDVQKKYEASRRVYGDRVGVGIIFIWVPVLLQGIGYFFSNLSNKRKDDAINTALDEHRQKYPEKYL